MLMTLKLESALRRAAFNHRAQKRRGSDVPYVEHVVGVAMILDRLGFPEDVVIAGLLHDLVEDTGATVAQVRSEFGEEVAEVVHFCSEVKLDEQGLKRPWIDRKRDHLREVEHATNAARAVVLADKLHNLVSIQLDLEAGRPVWASFHAGREEVLWYYRSMIEICERNDARLERLGRECRTVLSVVESL